MNKWIGPIVLAVVGILIGIVAIEYLTTPIHALPTIIGGKHIRGHYQRRGEALAVLAVVFLGIAAYWAYRTNQAGDGAGRGTPRTPAGDSPATTDSLLGSPPPTEQPPTEK